MEEEKTLAEFDAFEHPMELELRDGEEGGEGDNDGDNNNKEADDEDEEGEEEEEEDGSGEYKFQFGAEMDPLAFTEVDAFGRQPYQQFEHLEHQYEALAAKKRKAQALPPRCVSECSEIPAKKSRQEDRQEDGPGASYDEILEAMNYGMRRKSRKLKKRGRRKGSKSKVSSELKRKLGDATLHYAHGRYEEAKLVLREVVRLSPNLPDPYHTLGLIYNAMGDKKRAMNFYMLAAHLSPKDASLWNLLVAWSTDQGDRKQTRYCLSKAIKADPEDLSLRFHRASIYIELGDYQKAAEQYEQIARLCPNDVGVLKTAVQFYSKCGKHECSVGILEDYLKNHPTEADLSVIHLLAVIHMEDNAHLKALDLIEWAKQRYFTGKQMPLNLNIKAGICHLHLGHIEEAEIIFRAVQSENASQHPDIVTEVADSLMTLEYYESALKYYMMLVGDDNKNKGYLHLRIAECYVFLRERVQAIEYFYKAVNELEDSVDARLTLSSILLEDGKDDEAVSVLSPPKESESSGDSSSGTPKSWWLSSKIKLKLCQIYRAKGSLEACVDVIFPLIRETLFLKSVQPKVKVRRRLSKSVLNQRIKVVDDHQTDTIFHGFKPVALASDLSKAARAKKLLRKKEMLKEAKKAAALAAGADWKSDDSDSEFPEEHVYREPPLPDLLKDEEHLCLIVDLCKALISLQRYWDALEIINLCLKLASSTLSVEKKEELQALGAQVGYNIADPIHGFDCARSIVGQHPYSFAAWNCYYKVISRLDNRHSKHSKFLSHMRAKHKDCIPPIIIAGHQFTTISHHQDAAREYLEAYKLMPDNQLINLCVGSAIVNVALGFRLLNKHQCVLQGMAFLHNNLRLSGNSQEALFNFGRACHHVGLVSEAAIYYQRVLDTHEDDYPIPKLPNENLDPVENRKPGYCDLRREAAYNLHLIYKNSGAHDLARQILKDYCTV
ncbi:general transcription factor 3C polypeptide 3 isoform X3 [Solanum tuberosum]|uniref:general transcription factor 3C polypeptide 3 isoform X3 n=1 Tax=Solanum tuberosum TaxID=4113 RepID=UPI00073A24D3|nr:PREDICTED: general transcription factor 3C polypeptide 3 isoform X3 [Solanum tuberosum]